MRKQELAPADVETLQTRTFSEPIRLIFVGPLRGGPPVSLIRKVLAPKGKLRLSGTAAKIFADLDPGSPEAEKITLDQIVRSDAKGLERAILSALPHVDTIQIGIDGRSDEETRAVAVAYADSVWTFGASDLGLTEEEWADNKIHFSKARNIGRDRVSTPWTFVLDSDEIFQGENVDIREAVAQVGPDVPGFGIDVNIEGNLNHDTQRLARTEFKWVRGSHNLLEFPEKQSPGRIDAKIIHDPSLRSVQETARRDAQRAGGIEQLKREAKEEGDLNAMFHVAKHLLGDFNVEEGLKWVEDFRKRVMPWSEGSEERAHLATCLGVLYYEKNDFVEAELWAFRALLDGPYLDAFCLLGDIAEDRGSLKAAHVWYEAACVTDPAKNVGLTTTQHIRQGRLLGIKKALGLA